MPEIVPTAPELIAEAMHDSAVAQASASEIFTVYPANSSRSELDFLKISVRGTKYSRARGNPGASTPEELDFFASLIVPRYAETPNVLRRQNVIPVMTNLLRGGNHVAVGDSHGELFDVPVNLVNVSGRLFEQNVPHRTALIASKGVDYMGVNIEAIGGPESDLVKWMIGRGARMLSDGTIPVRSVLGLVTNRLYLTVPVSRSFFNIRESEDAAKLIRHFNSFSRAAIAMSMKLPKVPPLVLALGISGTKVKELDKDLFEANAEMGIDYRTVPERVDMDRMVRVLGRVSSATVEMVKGMYLFPTATNLNSSPPTLAFGDMLYMDGQHDAVDVGGALVELELRLHPGQQVVYDVDGKLPIK